MFYTIENSKIKVTVSDMGAEMTSLILKKTGTEYLWQGNPEYWTGHAYNLFPICGRLWDGKYTYRGKTYEMNLHGFARKTAYEMINSTADSISFRLTDSEKTLAQYPFRFALTLTYTLDGSTVRTSFHVENRDEKELIFAIGGHPGFNVPLADGDKFEDYTLTFSEKCEPMQVCFSEACFCLEQRTPFKLRCGKSFKLTHNLFDNDAVFLTNVAEEVTLKSSVSKRFVKVTYPGMKYVGFWHSPKTTAPFCCIEPWMSIPADDGKVDDLETKRDMLKIAPAASYDQSFDITIG